MFTSGQGCEVSRNAPRNVLFSHQKDCYNRLTHPPQNTPQLHQGPTRMIDYYEFLQISPQADSETIHRIYRYLAGRLHPDNPESGNPEMFRLLRTAYETLSNRQNGQNTTGWSAAMGAKARHFRVRSTSWITSKAS